MGRTSRKHALDRLILPSIWHVQVETNVNQIEVVALEDASFLLSKKPRCPLGNQVGDDNSTSVNEPFTCALQIFFSNNPFTHVYRPLDPNAWPKMLQL